MNYFKRFIELSKNIKSVYFECPNCKHKIDITTSFDEQVMRIKNIFRALNRMPNKNPFAYWSCDCDKCKKEIKVEFLDYNNAKLIFNYNDEFIENINLNEYFQLSQHVFFIEKD